MIGRLRICVRKQPIIVLYFESETVLKFYNLEAWWLAALIWIVSALKKWQYLPHKNKIWVLNASYKANGKAQMSLAATAHLCSLS